MSSDLVKVAHGELLDADGRRAALQRLNVEAAAVQDPASAQALMVQGRVAAEALRSMRAPFEDAHLAGRASVVASRKLGAMLRDLPSKARDARVGVGALPSERGVVVRELGLGWPLARELVRLGAVDDPAFQRYIQDKTCIPSLNGALVACIGKGVSGGRRSNGDMGWRSVRRRKAGVKTPAHPSLDAAYSEIVRALGHLGGIRGGGPPRVVAVSRAMELLYEAEDLLKPYRAGYGEARNRKVGAAA